MDQAASGEELEGAIVLADGVQAVDVE